MPDCGIGWTKLCALIYVEKSTAQTSDSWFTKSETMIRIAMMRLMLHRLKPKKN